MKIEHRLKPRLEHYYCMVDVLGHAGCVKEAEQLIAEMPFEPDPYIWRSLLGASELGMGDRLGKVRIAVNKVGAEKEGKSWIEISS
ncbi:hypothetical protein ACFX11_019729 [Malus domestica]